VTAQSATRIGPDLDSIAMLALQKEPTRRYSSVELLAADVRRYLESRPVLARGNALPDRVGKFVRRNRLATAVSAAVALAVIIGTVLIARNEHAFAAQSAQRVAAAHRTARFLLRELRQRSDSAVAGEAADAEKLVTRLEAIAAKTPDEEPLRRELEAVVPAQASSATAASTVR
jgi:hypothetical protein